MKKLIYLTTFLALFILGCEKQEMEDQLNGNWKIRAISGSIVGGAPVRDFEKVSFSSSNKYSLYFNDTIIQGGSYKIKKQDIKNYGNTKVEFLLKLNKTFDNHPYANFYSELPFDIIFYGTDTLTLSQPFSDGYNYHFVRE